MLLEVEGLEKAFGGLKAISGISFGVSEGEILGLIGPNGAGKTTLFNLISGFLKPTKGIIKYKGNPIQHLPNYQIAQLGIGRTFQATRIFQDQSVLDNLRIGALSKGNTSITRALFGLWSEETEHSCLDIVKMIDLAGEENSRACDLNQEKQKRLSIGIALAAKPGLLLLDEPTGGVNVDEMTQLVEIIKRINSQGITICLIEHKLKMVMELCTRLIVLNFGEKIAEGTPLEIKYNESAIKAYLGDEYASSC
jgi:branched-chain amino acid transport system ATP-binding protein